MNEYELSEDIDKTRERLNAAEDFETRLALSRLLEILRSWKALADKKG